MPQSVILQPFLPMEFPPFSNFGPKKFLSVETKFCQGKKINDVESHDLARKLRFFLALSPSGGGRQGEERGRNIILLL